MINVEVQKENTENSLTLLRRFTKRVQGSGVLPRVRSIRYSTRHLSETVKKKRALKKIRARAYIQEQIKLGKLVETTRTNGKKRR